MDQRNKHEESVNNAMIAGVLLRNQNPHVAQPLLTYAHENRLKAQNTQKKMNEIRSGGKIDFHQAKQELAQLSGFTKFHDILRPSNHYWYKSKAERSISSQPKLRFQSKLTSQPKIRLKESGRADERVREKVYAKIVHGRYNS